MSTQVQPVSLSATDKEIKKSTSFIKTRKLQYAKAHARAVYERKKAGESATDYLHQLMDQERISFRRAVYTAIAAAAAVLAYGHGVWF